MAQFIQYLYEYEKGEKVRSVGFMKVDQQMDKTIIQIYAKQIDEIKGIRFQREDGSRYLAAWEAEEYEEETEKENENTEELMEQEKLEQEKLAQELEVEEDISAQDNEIQIIHFETEDVDEYVPPVSRRYEKIQRQDLSRLPRKEWRLANNSFLLHGFYNYHHLLYIEEGDMVWIGVPGVYHPKERAAASAFGFNEFIRLADVEVELSDEEKNTYDDFGYWCRQVERS